VWQPPGFLAPATKALWLRHDADTAGNSEYEAFLAKGDKSTVSRAVDPAAPLLMVYTAAFGGRPAGALITHQALVAQSPGPMPRRAGSRRITAI